MSLTIRQPDPVRAAARQAAIEITIWTTKDGREIPLDEMTDDHVANAVRVLTRWRSRLRKLDRTNPTVRDLADAIARFKRLQRRRAKSTSSDQSRPSLGSRFLKPVAKT
jgi:hypothetical protein